MRLCTLHCDHNYRVEGLPWRTVMGEGGGGGSDFWGRESMMFFQFIVPSPHISAEVLHTHTLPHRLLPLALQNSSSVVHYHNTHTHQDSHFGKIESDGSFILRFPALQLIKRNSSVLDASPSPVSFRRFGRPFAGPLPRA